jgi:large subunit ribosomal protein L29
MKAEKLREMTVDELRLEETKLQDQIFRLRFQIAASQAENPAKVHLLRKDLARVKTVMRQKVGPRPAGRPAQAAAAAAQAPAVSAPAAAEPVKARTRSKAGAATSAPAPAAGKRAGRAAASRESKSSKQGAKR